MTTLTDSDSALVGLAWQQNPTPPQTSALVSRGLFSVI